MSVTGPTAAVAVAAAYATTAPAALVALTTRFGLMEVITGAVVSWTRTVKLALEPLPDPSVAVTQTVVVPSLKTAPDSRE